MKIKSIAALTISLVTIFSCSVEPDKDLEKAIDIDTTIFTKQNTIINSDSNYKTSGDSITNSIYREKDSMHLDHNHKYID